MHLGKKIRYCRKLKGVTLEELGEKANVCSKYIGEIERGEKTPSVTILQKIAIALEVHICFLLSSSEMEEQHFNYLASINRILYMRDIETLHKINEIFKIVFEEKC